MDTWEPPHPGRHLGTSSLGRRIAELRGTKGWTQQQLADRLGISRVAVSHLETDLNVAGERTVALLAGCFGLEPHDLVAGTNYPLAKADRLPLVVARWTEVDHQIALLDRDLWWLDQTEASPGVTEALLAGWEATLSKLADATLDAAGSAALARARARINQLRSP